ncbi:hypothetical protein [Nocardia sp. NPDC056000]|uniref:hypothetical protein n=1 Tax=Nocardia sp. NPDC056000 TaxID=3345674 RepID=UPI0035DAE54F
MNRRSTLWGIEIRWNMLVRVSAVYTATATAGLAIMMPVSYGWYGLPPYKVDLMIRSVPRAMESGAMVAVLAAALVVGIGSARAAWFATTLGLLGILANHAGLPWVDIDSLTTFNFIDSLWAGVIVGSLAPVVWTSRKATSVYLFGVISSAALGNIVQRPAAGGDLNPIERVLGDAPPVWLIVLALVLIGLGLLIRAIGFPVAPPDERVSLATVVSGAIVIFSVAMTSKWLSHSGAHPAVVVIAVLVVITGSAISAFMLPGRDGIPVLLLVAFAAAASATVTVPRPWWADALVILAVGLGLAAARRWPMPPVAISLSFAMALVAMILALVTTPGQVSSVLGVVCIGLVGGYSVAAALPALATSMVVAIGALFVPSAAVALRGRLFGRVSYSPGWYRVAPAPHDPVPAYAALGIAIGCGGVIYLLYRLRSVAEKDGGGLAYPGNNQ